MKLTYELEWRLNGGEIRKSQECINDDCIKALIMDDIVDQLPNSVLDKVEFIGIEIIEVDDQ
jgi:hypothetical protein